MNTKICKTCKIEKPEEEFKIIMSGGKKVYGLHCLPCCREYSKKLRLKNLEHYKSQNKASYEKHREKRVAHAKAYVKANKDKVKTWQKKALSKQREKYIAFKSTLSCTKCGENHISCLEFHHVDPSKKEGLISHMSYFPNKMKKELEKCVVLCSNCHRKLHYENKQLNT